MLWDVNSYADLFPCPLPVVPQDVVRDTTVVTNTACLALMDTSCASHVWEDLLYDGHDHDHGAGGLMLNAASVGTHVEYDGTFPVRVVTDEQGRALSIEIGLDPYAEDLDSLRRPEGWVAHDDEAEESAAHGHGDEDGWSQPVTLRLDSANAVLGDPSGLPEADGVGGLLDVVWPAASGQLKISVLSRGGVRKLLRAVWRAR